MSDDIDNNLKDALQHTLSDTQYDKVRSIGASLANGLTIAEACIISNVDIDKFLNLSKKNKAVNDYILFKQTNFKATLIEQLFQQAKTDTKVAQWFLERLYDEYNPRSKAQSLVSEEEHPLMQGLAYVRRNGDSTPLATRCITKKDNE